MKDRQAFDDLIFRNRNKEYGAYMLRKKYSSLVIRSIIVSVIIICTVVLVPFINILRKANEPVSNAGMRYVSMQMEKLEPPKDEIIVPPDVPPPLQSSQPVIRYVAPVVVDTVLPEEKPAPTVADVQASPEKNNEEITVSTSASESELVGDPNGEGGDAPFILVEVTPTFKGGNLDKFREWVQKRVIYPKEAQDKGIQGRVYLTFVIERDGSVSTVKVVKGVDNLLDDEAKRAIESSPKWSPGLQRGRPVRVRFSIFLNFTL